MDPATDGAVVAELETDHGQVNETSSAPNEQNVRSEQSGRTAFFGVLGRTNVRAYRVEQYSERTQR